MRKAEGERGLDSLFMNVVSILDYFINKVCHDWQLYFHVFVFSSLSMVDVYLSRK